MSFAARHLMPALYGRRFHEYPGYRREAMALAAMGVGGFILFDGTSEQMRRAVEAVRNEAPHEIIIACDLEPALRGRILDAPEFPHSRALARCGPAAVRNVAAAIGRHALSCGIDLTFAPVCDVNSNPRNPIINTRAFGETVDGVSTFVRSYIEGCRDAGILCVAKHFPGHGDTTVDSHAALPSITRTRAEILGVELPPFEIAFSLQVDGVMIAHLLVGAFDAELPATMSPLIVETLLRKELRYQGAVFTDAFNMKAITDRFEPVDAVIKSIEAGCDIVIMPLDPVGASAAIESMALGNPAFDLRHRNSLRRIETLVAGRAHNSRSWTETENSDANALGERCAMLALNVDGDIPANPGTIGLLLVGESDASTFESARALVYSHVVRISNLNELEGAKMLIQQADTIICLLFSHVRSFRGHLGEAAELMNRIRETLLAGTTTIGVAVGNPYIWNDLFDFDVKITTYSDSSPSVSAVFDHLRAILPRS
jgi:beta-glucosidase-like glycosyl hydrolase